MQFKFIMENHFLKWALLIWISLMASCVQTAKILGLFPHASESNFMVMRTFMMELARREHNVTIYSSHRLDERLDNLKEYVIDPEYQFWKEVQKQAEVKDLSELSNINVQKLEKSLAKAGYALMDYFWTNYQVKELLKMDPNTFDYDLIVIDMFYTESLLALGAHFNVPVIGIVSKDFANYMDKVQESLLPSACLPYDLENYDLNAGFWQRLGNIKDCQRRREQFVADNHGAQERIVEKHFNFPKGAVPSIKHMQNTAMALLLYNNYPPLYMPKPSLPSIVPVGGIQIRSARELPWHVRRFLDDGRSGVIYMHLGDEQLCAQIPKDKLDVLFHVFAEREERVLWTCHDVQKIEGQPKNIMIQHMVSQTDILAHPHIKLFIMNGDIMGLQEAIVRHVPVLGFPLFPNEFKNVIKAEQLQIGLRIDFKNLTQQSLKWALDTMLLQDYYTLNIRDVSKVFRDRPLGGLANAVFWLDYILNYGSGPLKMPNVEISSSVLHLVDLFLYNFGVALSVLCLLVALYFLGIFLWRKKHSEKMFSKLN